MYLLALVLAVAAAACFAWSAVPHAARTPPSRLSTINWLAVGLALLTLTIVAQSSLDGRMNSDRRYV